MVKRMRNEMVRCNVGKETNERQAHRDARNAPCPEDALNEIGVFSHLSARPDQPRFLLRMLAVFNDDRETWLVTEYANGGEIFAVVASKGPFGEADVCRYMWQLLQALRYLVDCRIGHRDVSLENLLLHNDELRLMDFGQAVQSHDAAGLPLRYFRAAGKAVYRAPECCVPRKFCAMKVVAPRPGFAGGPGAPGGGKGAGKSKGSGGGSGGGEGGTVMAQLGGYFCEVRIPVGATPGEECLADFVGYTVPPADIFSCGVCMFILAWAVPIWKHAVLEDAHFAYVHNLKDAGIPAILKAWRKAMLSDAAMELLVTMLRSNPLKRPTVDDCLASPFFAGWAGEVPPLHPPLGEGVPAPPPPPSPPRAMAALEEGLRGVSVADTAISGATWFSCTEGATGPSSSDPYRDGA